MGVAASASHDPDEDGASKVATQDVAPERAAPPPDAGERLDRLRAAALASLPARNRMVEVVGAARAVLHAMPVDEWSGETTGAEEYTELARYAGHVTFEPSQWARSSTIAASETAYPIVIVGGRFHNDEYVPEVNASFAGHRMRPLLAGDPAVVVRLYARFRGKRTWPIQAVNVAVLPLLGWYVNDGRFGALCEGKVCLAPSIQVLGVERPVKEALVGTEARELACRRGLRTNPAACHACARSKELVDPSIWRKRFEACKRALTARDAPSRTFFLLRCAHALEPDGASLDGSDATCNRLVVSRHRHSDGTSTYALIRTVSRFLLRVAQMAVTMGGVDETLLADLGEMGFYETDPEFRRVLDGHLGARIRCRRLDYDQLEKMLIRLFKKGYDWKQFAMRADDALSDERPTLATPGDPIGANGDALSKKLNQLGFASAQTRT